VALKEYLPAALASRASGDAAIVVAQEKRALYRIGFRSFLEEGRALAQIVHPNVVSVLNFFQENDTVYLVMNYLRGASLQQFIVTSASLGHTKVFRESTIRSLFEEVLRGLRVVHQHKMLHLDIKPGNILVTDDDRAVLLDFGAARNVLHQDGKFLQPMFTPGFSAPEMYRRGKPIGPWTDIYAIGACMFSCMKGCPPPDAAKADCRPKLEAMVADLHGKYSPMLMELVLSCMQMDPQARPHSVLSVQKVLSRPPQVALATEADRYQATQFLPDALRLASKLPA
jgi:serine/threonine protein kinase